MCIRDRFPSPYPFPPFLSYMQFTSPLINFPNSSNADIICSMPVRNKSLMQHASFMDLICFSIHQWVVGLNPQFFAKWLHRYEGLVARCVGWQLERQIAKHIYTYASVGLCMSFMFFYKWSWLFVCVSFARISSWLVVNLIVSTIDLMQRFLSKLSTLYVELSQ